MRHRTSRGARAVHPVGVRCFGVGPTEWGGGEDMGAYIGTSRAWVG